MAYGYQSGYNPQRNGNFVAELPESLLLGSWHRKGFEKGAPVYVGNNKKDGSGADYVYSVEGVEGTTAPDSSYIVCYSRSGVLQWRTKLPAGRDPASYSWLYGIFYPTADGLILCGRRNQTGTGEAFTALDAVTGAVTWHGTRFYDQYFIRDQVVIDSDGAIVVCTRAADGSNNGLTKINGADGSVLWVKELYPGPHNLTWLTATYSPEEDFLYVLWDGQITTLDPADGSTLFSTSVIGGATTTVTFITCDVKFVWVYVGATFNSSNSRLLCFLRNEDGSLTQVPFFPPKVGEPAWHFLRAIPPQYGLHAATWHYRRTVPGEQDRLELVDDQFKTVFSMALPFDTGDGLWTEVLFDSNARLLYINRGRQGSMHCMNYLPAEVAENWNKRQEDPALMVEAQGDVLWAHPLGDARYCQPWVDVEGVLYVNANGGLIAYGGAVDAGDGKPPVELGPPVEGGFLADGTELISLTAAPTAVNGAGTWVDAAEAYTTDGLVASTEAPDDIEEYITATGLDAIPATATIHSVAVVLVGNKDTVGGDGTLYFTVELSWDAGVTWTSPAKSALLSTDLDELVVGGPQFERAWTAAELGSAFFQMRITAKGDAIVDIPAWNLDSIEARVTYSE